jgi:hypothetical protein
MTTRRPCSPGLEAGIAAIKPKVGRVLDLSP